MFEGILIAVEGVFIVRICAMYGHHRVLMVVILVPYFGEIATVITLLAISTMGMQFDQECLVVRAPIYATYWIVPLVFETFLFSLITIKFFTSIGRQLDKRPILFVTGYGHTPSSLVYISLTSTLGPVAMLLNTLMYNLLHNARADTALPWETSIISFAGSHVLLNIRRVSAERNSYVPSMWTAYGADAELRFGNEIPTAVSLNAILDMDSSALSARVSRLFAVV
ncbi:hypothetical protein WOLCODRAFT_156282 [Wolfiporia cocos MD-104 SS10]|uniref:Uncharacterized protein n=1 Tax=Wolfiporia cocos (strain MD-104) TaxID=742152 RepID=A0A2H3J0T8_WOLCO|nr:hypothetical protein WOLCODRAFT_156282 [Wolfiporia cocos MD-104 SS10]